MKFYRLEKMLSPHVRRVRYRQYIILPNNITIFRLKMLTELIS